jgi:MFS family permease
VSAEPLQGTGPYNHGWNILAVGLLFQAATFGITFYCFTLWVQPWMDTFNATRSEVMTIFVVTQIMLGASSPFAGRAMDALQIRTLVTVGTLCFAAALWLIAQATALWQIGVLYGTLFMSGSLLAGPLAAQTLAARWFTENRATAIGLVSVGTSLGGISMPILVGWLLTQSDWRAAHEVLAVGVAVLVTPAVWLVVRNSPADTTFEPAHDAIVVQGAEPTGAWTTLSLITNRNFLLIVLATTPLATAAGAIQQNLAPYASELSVAPQQIALLISIMAAVMVAGKVCYGLLADRFDHRILFGSAIGLVWATLVLLGQQPDYLMLTLIISLLGFGMGGFLPLLGAMVASRFGADAFGRAMGLIGPFTTVAAVGPLIAAYIRDSSGSYDVAWLLMMVILVPSAIAIALLKRR